MKAFHDNLEIKDNYILRVKHHKAADEIVQGKYWENGKGCAVGCTIHGSDHSKYETELGIPKVIARLEDRIFEGLSKEDAKEWPLDFLESINVGADLSLVWPKFAIWILTDPKYGISQHNKSSAITDVATLYKLLIDGKPPTIEEWKKARSAAYAATATATGAYAAAYATDAYAATATAYAAYAAAAAAAAYAAAYAAYATDAYTAAGRGWYRAASEKLLEILRETI